MPRVWQGVGYRPLPDAAAARRLLEFAAVSWPDNVEPAFCWGAHAVVATGEQRIGATITTGERLIGAIVAEKADRTAMLYGPVVDVDTAALGLETEGALEVAAQLVAASLDHATALGIETVFARPQGLDRVWIRYGFIPLPESALPAAFAGRPAVGLYAWRGGSALWTFREPSHN